MVSLALDIGRPRLIVQAAISLTGVRFGPVVSDMVRVPRARRTCSRGGVTLVSWDQEFFDPIVLPGRAPLLTLRDAAHYITKLPKAEHDAEEWQAAM